MKLTIERDQLLRPLGLVTGVVERRQTLPILSNVFLSLDDGVLTLIGTDLEVEVNYKIGVIEGDDGQCTVTARKLLDICRALPETATVTLEKTGDVVKVASGRSRFTLQSLPPDDFPRLETDDWEERAKLMQGVLRRLLEKTSFSMAQQDVRYFLNGVLFELEGDRVRTVATDGHRLAKSEASLEVSFDRPRQAIVPRKAVLELGRFLDDSEDEVTVEINPNHMKLTKSDSVLTTKLIDGKFPDYQAVMAQVLERKLLTDRSQFHDVLARTSVLTNEKFRGVRFGLSAGVLEVTAHNPEQEEASDELAIEYDGEAVEIGFNVTYLMDALRAIDGKNVEMEFQDGNSGALLHAPDDAETLYLIMPMRL